jgi:hypothetical protein
MTPAFDDAIAYAQAHDTPWPRRPADPAPFGGAPWGVHHDDPPPFNRLRGPVHERGPQSGVVWQRGVPLVAWGEPGRADLTFSVAKTYHARRHGHLVWVQPDHAMVLRWLDPAHLAEAVSRFAAALA